MLKQKTTIEKNIDVINNNRIHLHDKQLLKNIKKWISDNFLEDVKDSSDLYMRNSYSISAKKLISDFNLTDKADIEILNSTNEELAIMFQNSETKKDSERIFNLIYIKNLKLLAWFFNWKTFTWWCIKNSNEDFLQIYSIALLRALKDFKQGEKSKVSTFSYRYFQSYRDTVRSLYWEHVKLPKQAIVDEFIIKNLLDDYFFRWSTVRTWLTYAEILDAYETLTNSKVKQWSWIQLILAKYFNSVNSSNTFSTDSEKTAITWSDDSIILEVKDTNKSIQDTISDKLESEDNSKLIQDFSKTSNMNWILTYCFILYNWLEENFDINELNLNWIQALKWISVDTLISKLKHWEDKETLQSIWELFWTTRERIRQYIKEFSIKFKEYRESVIKVDY